MIYMLKIGHILRKRGREEGFQTAEIALHGLLVVS
ncbi:MAG: hypothetical protein JWN90_79 [Parcubacteria group bacterium]|nr:hypothetical protein [Parcubacteria group bacterium]